jgi:hypothetical protein
MAAGAQASGRAEGCTISQMNQAVPMIGTSAMNTQAQCLPASRRRRIVTDRETLENQADLRGRLPRNRQQT